jgi:hypothetical protein
VESFLATQGLSIIKDSPRNSIVILAPDGWLKTMESEVQLLMSFCATGEPVKICTAATRRDKPTELGFGSGSYVLLSEGLCYWTKPAGIPFSIRSFFTSALDSETTPSQDRAEQASSSSVGGSVLDSLANQS